MTPKQKTQQSTTQQFSDHLPKSGDCGKASKKTTATRKLVESVLSLDSGGRPATMDTQAHKRRRVMRSGGFADRIAGWLTYMLECVNKMGLPVSLKDVLSKSDEGAKLLAELKTSKNTKVLAQAAVDMASLAGGACTSAVVGVLAKPNSEGRVSTGCVAEATGVSSSWVRASRLRAQQGKLGVFGTQKTVGGTRATQRTRQAVPREEEVI